MTSDILISIFDSIPVWVMLAPIFICSILLLAVFIERMVFYKKTDIDYRLLMDSIAEKIKKKDFSEAKLLCGQGRNPLCDMIYDFLYRWNEHEDKQSILRYLSEQTIRSVEKYGGVIATIATISPMLGLLGTVTGMMKSFSGLAKLGPSARDLLAQGITEALITTVLGLLVAIPSILFYNFMVSRIDRFVRDIEFIANSLNDLYKVK